MLPTFMATNVIQVAWIYELKIRLKIGKLCAGLSKVMVWEILI